MGKKYLVKGWLIGSLALSLILFFYAIWINFKLEKQVRILQQQQHLYYDTNIKSCAPELNKDYCPESLKK